MFVVYLATFYHLATPATLGKLAELADWDWGPKFFAPVTFLVTYPIRWLPDALKLPALNFFAAICATLTLALLARSVALLPHDRTNEQRLREQSEFSLLSIPTAWLPPLFAVLVCGLQLSFWERAVEFRDVSFADNGEMFNLLIFAYVVRCLLEYRISRNESWLTRFSLVYGLGMANNWAMIAFFPGFLAALIWIKGLEFFHWRSVVRTLILGLAGASLVLLFPILNQVHHFTGYTFGDTLRVILSTFKMALFRLPPDKKWLLVFAVTSVVPVLLMGIRWGSSFGDNSPMGVALATFSFNLGHIFLLLCCLWVALDPPFSARELVGFLPYLPLYYLGALSVGYLSGYLLLVFGTRPVRMRQRPGMLVVWLRRIIVVSVGLLTIAIPLFLVGKNLPQIESGKAVAEASDRFFSRIQKVLPPAGGAVILMDNDSRLMAYSLRAVLARSNPKPDDIFIETTSLGQSWDYVHVLDARHPQAGIASIFTVTNIPQPQPLDCIHLIEKLAQNHEIYYLHPSFGYYFERFYPEDHGLVYRMNFFPTNAWTAPPPAPELLGENRKFWNEVSDDLQFIIHASRSAIDPFPAELGRKLEQFAGLSRETNQFAATLGSYYSRDLNYWGVELARSAPPQDTNTWLEAGKCFDLAEQLDPDNRSARINLGFNQSTLAGKAPEYKKLSEFDDALGGYREWYDVVTAGGPLDEPNFCRGFGVILREGNNFRQAIQQFERLQTIMPRDPSGPFQLAETYLYILNHPATFSYAYPPPLQTGLAATAAAERAASIEPNNTNTLSLKALSYWQLGLYIQAHTNQLDPCPSFTQAYSNSLSAIEQWLRLTPDEPNALFFKSMSLMQLGQYDLAVAPLTMLISQSSNAVARLNRAICYFRAGTYDAAKQDYLEVKKVHPEAYQADYGLAEIAYHEKDFTNAIMYYGSYESNAPPAMQNTDEYKGVVARLKELKASPP